MPVYDLSDVILRGLRSAQPAADIPGRLYYVTDENVLERDTGATWENVEGGDMFISVYDTNDDGQVNAADAADAVPWSGLTGTPAKLDDLSAPDDNTDLNASLTAHGLLLKLGGGTTNYLRADGTWAAPSGTGMSNPMTTEGDIIKGGASGTPERLAIGTDGYRLASTGTAPAWEADYYEIPIIIGNGVDVITTGLKGWLRVPQAGTIVSSAIVADASGSIVVDIWKDVFANLPATDADTITASAPPTLSSAQTAEDTTLTGWTIALAAGDWLYYNVDSATTVKQVTLSLRVRKT